MTVIAFDGTTIAADRGAVSHGHMRAMRKLFPLPDGSIAAITGEAPHAIAIKNWLIDGADPSRFPKPQVAEDPGYLWVVKPDRTIMVYEGTPWPLTFMDQTFAAGCGRDYAVGAMSMGASAIEAVNIACKHDVNCGMGVDSYRIGIDTCTSEKPSSSPPALVLASGGQ